LTLTPNPVAERHTENEFWRLIASVEQSPVFPSIGQAEFVAIGALQRDPETEKPVFK
jgi:hypothetical protein